MVGEDSVAPLVEGDDLQELNGSAAGNMFDGQQEAEYDEIDNAH